MNVALYITQNTVVETKIKAYSAIANACFSKERQAFAMVLKYPEQMDQTAKKKYSVISSGDSFWPCSTHQRTVSTKVEAM